MKLRAFYRSAETFLLCCITLASGCTLAREESLAPVAQFLKEQPKEASKFVFIYPVSLDAFKELNRLHSETLDGIATELMARFGRLAGVSDYVSFLVRFAEGQEREGQKQYDELLVAARPDGAVCEYEWTDGKTIEIGLMVLKGGKIVLHPAPFSGPAGIQKEVANPEAVRAKEDAVATFLDRLPPEKREAYIYIHPVDTTLYMLQYSGHYGVVWSIVQELKSRFGRLEGMNEFVQSAWEKVDKGQQQWEHRCKELTVASSGGVVCEYKWSKGTLPEVGLLVLKAGQIAKCFPFTNSPNWEYLAESTIVEGEPCSRR